MYRTNNYGATPRDRLDPRLLDRFGMSCQEECRTHDHSNGRNTVEEPADEFDYSLAMVYSPKQAWQNLYSVEDGLYAGTIFKELDKPFYGPKCNGGTCYE